MTTGSTVNKAVRWAFPAREAAAWLALAASPTFALMAWIAANEAPATAFCGSGSRFASLQGMAAMYLLMSVFHLSPWLRLACRRLQPCSQGD